MAKRLTINDFKKESCQSYAQSCRGCYFRYNDFCVDHHLMNALIEKFGCCAIDCGHIFIRKPKK